ncbi:IS701 family transposase [Fimbriiglobus ruber]|uniref:Mobile element protein n=1 Tax=Fimbriiglobus ruber TaxID=1908690 RepID=A0A225DAF2_9BACT|nr:IS701 family transposase [Fimbriiglobus ruber]OWK34109.1 Mobile element protein [Fimbriiglobus ruber]
MDEQELLRLKPELDRFLDQFTPLFGRSENDGHARRFVQGLLRGGDRRNSENIAEATNGGPVRSLQAFVAPGVWSDRALLSDVRQAVVDALTDPDAVLNVDETGFPKKGTKSVGVQRQYSGTLGRVDNCQIGVFANYASSRGHAVVDRRWYLPEEWVEDGPRCQDAGVPEGVVFRTQPELAREMIADAIAAGVPFRWVGGDSVYGDNPTFVQGVRRLGKWYVLDIACDTQVWTRQPEVIPADQRPKPPRGRRPTKPRVEGARRRVDEVIADLPATAWRRVVVGDGTKGPRVYEYAEATVWFREDERPGPPERLLARRSLSQEPEVTYHRSNAPADVGREKLAEVRGRRWTIEEDFQIGKGECGLDEYETRGWVGWHHHTALSMLALAFLVLQKHRLGEKRAPDDRSRSAGSPHAPVGRSGMERGGDPEVVPLATREESAGGRQPSKTTRRSRLTSLVG